MKYLRFEFTVTIPDDISALDIAAAIRSTLQWQQASDIRDMVVTPIHVEEEYEPKTGDVVVFPAAALKSNRTRHYTITNVQDNVVSFRVPFGDDAFDYSETVEVLHSLGMRLA